MTSPLRRTSCTTCAHRAGSEWCALTTADAARLDGMKVPQRYVAGQAIFHQGSPCLGLYCVSAGAVALRRGAADGSSVIVRLVHAFETLGYEALFTGEAHAVSAVALGECDVCFIARLDVERLLAGNAALARAFLRRMARDLSDAAEEKLRLATQPARDRLAGLLHALSGRYGAPLPRGGGVELRLPLARQDVASLLGVRPESVTRAVHQLEAEGLATFSGRVVRVPSVEALAPPSAASPPRLPVVRHSLK